eukprot:Ihof_evm6s193 gene=Ihof_evmTU6s193
MSTSTTPVAKKAGDKADDDNNNVNNNAMKREGEDSNQKRKRRKRSQKKKNDFEEAEKIKDKKEEEQKEGEKDKEKKTETTSKTDTTTTIAEKMAVSTATTTTAAADTTKKTIADTTKTTTADTTTTLETVAITQALSPTPNPVDTSLDPNGPVGSMLNCSICLSQPEAEVYQCSNGHLLCTDCHKRVGAEDSCACPTCRVRMSRNNPTRNYVAEKARDQLPASCENKGCNDALTVATIVLHQTTQCPFRPSKCQYYRIGCDWSGVYSDLTKHESACKFSSMSGEDILPLVVWREAQEEAERQKEKEIQAIDKNVVDILSSRCRNIEVRDVRLSLDEIVNDTSSTPFKCLGETWIATLRQRKAEGKGEKNIGMRKDGQTVERVGLRLSRQRGRRGNYPRLRLNVTVLKGPSHPIDLPPSVHSLVFEKGDRRSAYIPLPVEGSQANQLSSCHNIHLRLVFVDARNGLNREFTSERSSDALVGHRGSGNHSNSDSDSDDDNEGDDSDENDDECDSENENDHSCDSDSRSSADEEEGSDFYNDHPNYLPTHVLERMLNGSRPS